MEIYAHRGVSGLYPENTIIAFQKAAALPITGIELDVQLTKDQQMVVIHDESIQRTSTGSGFVKELTYDELLTYDFGSYFHKKFSGERLPLLADVLDLFKDTHHILHIELKTNKIAYKEIEQKVLKLIHQMNLAHRVIISSFNFDSIKRVHMIDPTIKTALLTMKELADPMVQLRENHADALHISQRIVNKQSILQLIQQGIPIRVFTVNRKRTYRHLKKLGVHGVFTDFPHKMI